MGDCGKKPKQTNKITFFKTQRGRERETWNDRTMNSDKGRVGGSAKQRGREKERQREREKERNKIKKVRKN